MTKSWGCGVFKVYSLSPGFWQSFISIEVCGDCIPALASSCKKTINGFLCLLIVFIKSKTYQLILKDVTKLNQKLTVTDRDKIVAGDPH